MNHLLRTAIMIVAAMTASAMILVGLFGMIWNVNLYGKTVADFLPQEGIRAILFYPTKQAIQEFQLLEDSPSSAEAIVIFKNYETVQFTKNADPKDESIGPYNIQVSNKAALGKIQEYDRPLQADETFKALQTYQGPEAQWTYLPLSSLPQSTDLFTRVLRTLLTGRSTSIALQHRANGLSILRPEEHTTHVKAPVSIPEMPDALLQGTFGNAQASLVSLLENLSQEDAIVLEGLLSNAITTFGEGVSFRYDILPLLEEPSSIQLSNSGGTLHVLLSGSMNRVKMLHTILDRLHTEFARTLPSSTITKRILDKRFSSIDIRHDVRSIEQSQSTVDGWLVHQTTLAGNAKGLTTATQGNRFLLGTTTQGVLHAIAHQQDFNEQHRAKLSVDTIQIEEIWPAASQKFGTGTLTIISSRDGSMHNMSLSASKNPLQLLEILTE